MPYAYHRDGTLPPDGASIFVFGSNAAGRHGAGAAKVARTLYGAVPGEGFGLAGRSYAIPTKDERLAVLPLDAIRVRVLLFVEFARAHPDLVFFVTRVGCGLAGYRDADIAPMFREAPTNCSFPEEWQSHLEIE